MNAGVIASGTIVAADAVTIGTIVIAAIVTISASTFLPLRMFDKKTKADAAARQAEADERRKERNEDYARQDAVAAQAVEAARLNEERQDRLEEQTAEAARQAAVAAELLKVNTEVVAISTAETQVKLQELNDGQKVIHSLVNSDMTAAKEAELLALRGQVVLHRRLSTLDGGKIDDDDAGAIAEIEKQIAKLSAELADRLAQQHLAEAEVAKA